MNKSMAAFVFIGVDIAEPNIAIIFTKLIVVLIAVCGIMYCFFRIMKYSANVMAKFRNHSSLVSVLTVYHLEQRKKLFVIKIADSYYLMSCSETDVKLLTKLPEEEIINYLNRNEIVHDNSKKKKS